jgi:hypothetical protein
MFGLILIDFSLEPALGCKVCVENVKLRASEGAADVGRVRRHGRGPDSRDKPPGALRELPPEPLAYQSPQASFGAFLMNSSHSLDSAWLTTKAQMPHYGLQIA